jgi:GR25 family glycosyltransferase involved in LPS biosynthesis
MKGRIVYIEGREDSEKQAKQAYDSFKKYNWDVELFVGIMPKTINEKDFPYPDVENGRLQGIHKNEPQKYLTKKSCLFNNLTFFKDVVDTNEPMAFIEHDAVCIGPYENRWIFRDFLFLSLDYCFKPPTVLSNYPHLNKWSPPFTMNGVKAFPEDYPLRYYKDTIYKGYMMSPGTAAYCVTPGGARKLLDAAEKNGLEQSDYHINSKNVLMEYVYPSPVKYNKVNLNTSHGN